MATVKVVWPPYSRTEAHDNLAKLSPKNFDPREQTWRLFKEQGVRLLITTVLVALFIATLKIYERLGTIDKIVRRVFNSIITCLSLILGLNFFVSARFTFSIRPWSNMLVYQDAFKDMAKVLRWRLLASRPFSVREADLILGADSLRTLTTLMRESWRKPCTLFVCMAWVSSLYFALRGLAATIRQRRMIALMQRPSHIAAGQLTYFF